MSKAKTLPTATAPIIANPPAPNKALLVISIVLWLMWLVWLIWLAMIVN